ncbi:MAG: hypothetical protein WB698_12910 [Solirubrobacteraceae bacterium]
MSDQTDVFEPIEQEQWLGDSQELPLRPRRRLLTPLPLALVAALLIACGFIGGALVEKAQTSPGSSAGSSSSFSALRSALGGASGTRGAGASTSANSFLSRIGGGATIGQVAYVHGGTLYVTNAEGNTVKVSTSEASTVSKTVKGTVGQIHPGETVTVIGEKGTGGAIVARSISVGSSAGDGLGAFLRGGSTGGSHTGTGGAASEGQSLFGG